MQQFLVSQDILTKLADLASQAPVPYYQTQALWKAVENLRPVKAEAKPAVPGKGE